jgi:hypothetical protein
MLCKRTDISLYPTYSSNVIVILVTTNFSTVVFTPVIVHYSYTATSMYTGLRQLLACLIITRYINITPVIVLYFYTALSICTIMLEYHGSVNEWSACIHNLRVNIVIDLLKYTVLH